MMAECFVCGRKLTNPCTAARGCGPVCCGTCGSRPSRRTEAKRFRSFYERVSIRWGRPWGLNWVLWVGAEKPCLTCRKIVLLKLEIDPDGKVVATDRKTALEARFAMTYAQAEEMLEPDYWEENSVPGWCRKRKRFIDANRPSAHRGAECSSYEVRTSARPGQMSLAEVVNG